MRWKVVFTVWTSTHTVNLIFGHEFLTYALWNTEQVGCGLTTALGGLRRCHTDGGAGCSVGALL